MHPRIEQNPDIMWEIYANIMPLEVIIQPSVFEHFLRVMHLLTSHSTCTEGREPIRKPINMWPFVYISAGGVRVIITEQKESLEKDDTFVINVGRIVVNPHPDNPICRKPINVAMDSTWTQASDGFEGRQYEMQIKSITVKTGLFQSIIAEEESEYPSKHPNIGQNPARKWSRTQGLVLTPVVHTISVSCVVAPPLYIGLTLQCGTGIEINLTSDCLVEINLDQIALMYNITEDLKYYYEYCLRSAYYESEREEKCPYEELLKPRVVPDASAVQSQTNLPEGSSRPLYNTTDTGVAPGTDIKNDSGLDSRSRSSTSANVTSLFKKTVSIGLIERGVVDPLEYLEVFVTVGSVEMSLYTLCETSNSPPKTDTTTARHYKLPDLKSDTEDATPDSPGTSPKIIHNSPPQRTGSIRSLTETVRHADKGQSALNINQFANFAARRSDGSVALMNITFYQPNLYYWRKKTVKNLQISLFNLWVGLGSGFLGGNWTAVLLSTARGVPDPLTDIPPALFTMRLVTSSSASTINSRGSLTVDFERPILVELCEERLARIKDMCDYFKEKYSKVVNGAETTNTPFLYKIRQFMQNKGIETVTIHTTQIGVQFLEGIVGWDSTSIQLGWNARPERLVIRSLISAFLIAVGPPCDNRRQILQPLHAGMLLEAMWEIWRRSEGRMSAREPSVRVCIDLDKITVDLRPSDLETIANLQKSMKTVFHKKVENETDSEDSCECCSQEKLMDECAINEEQRLSMASVEFAECNVGSDRGGNHFYKDDLRTGAFKIVSGGQLPMAYQVSLHRSIVSWRYPHPRAITRLILFPLPGMSTETDCVLELFNRQAREWKPHTYVKIPVNEPREVRLFIPSPEAVFCTTWRFRVYSSDEKKQNYEFDIKSYTPRPDPLVSDPVPETELKETNVTAEMLSGVLRVDSYFSPRLLPRIRVTVRLASAHIHAHNSLPKIHSNQSSVLEGYYVTKPLMRTHRVLTIGIQNMDTDFYFASPAGSLLLMSSELSSDIIDCATGILVPLVTPFSAQMAISVPKGQTSSRLRFCSSVIHASLHIPCIRTLSIVVSDWQEAKNKYFPKHTSAIRIVDPMKAKKEAESDVVDTLEGRVSLWIHNSCTFSVRVGQEGTDELVPLGPGAKLAYRWRCPAAPRRLRFAIASPSTEWRWSNSVKFVPSTRRVRLEDLETMDSSIATPGCGVFLYIKIDQQGATRQMRLTGRLMLANMLRFNLLFKIRAHFKELNQWRTVASGELTAETIGRSVICAANCELVLKIRLMNHETGWSGDIPLKECPKENVPWLVKVPSDGDVPFISVWCRVNRARSDGRILATIWPLYVLRSHLPLDTDVLIATEMDVQAPQSSSWSESRPPPLIHTAPGRGTSTHLMAPGTTSARHTLSFQYRNIECPVTREAVPLHYGVTDSSVFDKRPPVNNLEEVVVEINNWLERAGRNSTSNWPYSVVTSHWPGMWQPTLLQPRCEVAVRYEAVRAGGGCSLEVQISPVLLLCNASPIALTLRAHDAAPLCKLEPGSAISPSSAMLKKPFFMSVEVGRETFVSRQLKVTSKDPGRYGTPPPGELALDHAVTFAVQCSQKVALLTMHYEIKEDINVLGITATYMLVNRLDTDLLVSPIAIPRETDSDRLGLKRGSVRHKNLKLIPPTPSGTIQGVPLCRLWLMGRWRGREASDLRLYLYVSFAGPSGGNMRPSPVDELIPIQLGTAPLRRAISLRNIHGVSVPVVVTQQKHDGRWLISVARDPCPQYALLNNTPTDIAVAQPAQIVEEASTSAITVVPDCEGVEWLCTVKPKSLTHYSTPAHCARHPPTTETTANVPFLTFTQIYNENYHSGWCAPVAVTEGEQLVQLYHGSTIKLRVRVHPHSTYIELREVDDNDISASDIRRRLVEPETSASYDDNVYSREPAVKIEDKYLERVDADEKLLNDVENDSQDDTFALDIRGSLNEDDFVCTNDRIQVINLEKEVSHVKDNQQVKVTEDNEMIDEEIHKDKGEDIIEKNEEKDEKQFTNVKVVETLVLNDATLLALSQERPIKIPSLIDDLEGADEVKAIKLPLQEDILSAMTVTRTEDYSSELSSVYYGCEAMDDRPVENERVRAMIAGVIVDLAASSDSHPLLAVHLDRVVTLLTTQTKKIKTTVSIGDIQIDNLQYDSGQYDFAVIATTRDDRLEPDPWPPIMNMFVERNTFATKSDSARFLLKVCNDQWTIGSLEYNEITEVDIRGGPLALYVEDAYVKALAELFKLILPTQSSDSVAQALAEANTLQNPIRLRCLLIHPLDLTLTLHTAVRMYIALDQSPLHLSAFKLHNIVTSTERLVHALTVHYLSAAILGAGWVVGGLELLGAPGALAARVGGATGGVRGIASAAAAGLLRSLSAWAGSLARNLDLLAGDEEHARRAAAARRRPPDSLAAGLVAGITNFAINILGAVGGLAHHPLVGVAVGETESGATALRRGLLGALTKPLSATADLVAYAGHGLLKQTGWDPVPQPRSVWAPAELQGPSWERDCVRWTFRMAELTVHAGFEVLIDNSLHQILLTSKYIVVAEIDSERIIEMIDMRFCTLSPYEGPIIELHVKQRRQSKAPTETKTDDNDEVQVTAAAMARVARYTGAEVVASTSANTGDLRVLTLLPTPGQSYALHCALAALIHSNADTHFHLL